MSYQITKVDLIPNGEIITCNASQFDNGRVLPFEIYENKVAYNIPNDVRVELHCRKPDGNIVTLPSDTITNNIVTFITTTQLTACYGDNVCEISLYGPDDYLIGSANFILEVEKSPTYGGINSTSAIHNLETQIEEITTEVIGENYYNKTEVDVLLDSKADASSVYTKTQVDSALALKANASDVYTKSQTDTLLNAKADSDYVNTQLNILDDSIDYLADVVAGKANSSDVYTKAQVDSALALKANAADVYTKTEVDNIILDIMPVDTVSGPIATFNTELAASLVNVSSNIVATGGNGTPDNPNPINGYTEANITRCGVNLWDEQWEVGSINHITGEPFNDTARIRSKNYPPIKGGVEIYTIDPTNNYNIRLFYYDVDKNYIGASTWLGNQTSTTLAGACYFKFIMGSSYGTTYNHDISVLYPSSEHNYHAYNGQTFTVAFGQTVYGGVLDVTRGKLTVTHKEVDLGSLSWIYNSTLKRFYARYDDGIPSETAIGLTALCDTYPVDSANTYNDLPDNTMSVGSNYISGKVCAIVVHDETYTNEATFKTAMSGHYVVSELKTPFDIDLTPVQIRAIVGTNNVYSDTNGDTTVQYKDSIQHYIDNH